MHGARAGEDAAHAEPRRPGVQSDLEVVLAVEQCVEEVEARDPEAHRAAERPRLPRELAGDRDPRADGRQAETGAEP